MTVRAVVVMDASGRILEYDAEHLFGYPPEEAVGALLSDLVVPQRLRAAHEAGLRRWRETGTGPLLKHSFDLPALCRDGREIRVEVALTVNGPDRVTATMRELTGPVPVPGELFLAAEFHRALVEGSPIMISVLDADGTPRWSSSAGADLAGSPAGAEALRRAAAGDGDPVEVRLPGEGSAAQTLSLTARDLLANPAVHGVACYGTDITRARDAERRHRVEAARLAALIEGLNVGVLLQDEQQRVVLANSTFVELFALGLSSDRVSFTPPARQPDPGPAAPPLAPPRRASADFVQWYADQDGAEQRVADTIQRGRPTTGEEVVLGNGRVLERDYLPITLDGTTLGHLWVFHDVTAKAEIRRGLEARNRILTELSALKTEFVRVASHELRTPLTSIATFAAMLDADTGGGLADTPSGLDSGDREAAVAAIRRNAERMLILVADLLLLAKLESGEIALGRDPVDLAALLHKACEHAAHGPDPGTGHGYGQGPAVPVDARIGTGEPVIGDPGLLGQLVDTAVGLVVAAADSDGSVAVSASEDTSAWRIAVATATAEPASAERLLSTRLPHPDAPGEHRTGALALMLAREIAARHGGELTTGADEHGVTVTVRLPLRPCP